MANVNRPSGLSPVQYLNGSPWNGQARLYSIAASYNTALAIGDPVDVSGTADTNGVAGIVLATAGNTNPILGAIVGLGKYEGGIFNPSNLDQIIRPASDPAVWYAMVADDPHIIFEVQDIGTGTPLAAVDVGLNVDLASGTNNGYVSGWVLNNAAKAVTATYQMRLLGLARRQDNVIGQYGKWLTRINLHRLSDGSAGL
jgi:hypothetical protein